MKKIILLSFFLFSTAFIKAQNFVPNAGFEAHDTCPSLQDQVQYSTGWFKVSAASTTPDYYNACAPSSGLGVPQSYGLFQADLRSCGAYMGLITCQSQSFVNYREQIGVLLNQPLVVGQKYFLSFSTVMGGYKVGTDYYDNPSNNIGMKLSTVAYSASNPAPINNFAHLRSTAIITDTINWTRVSGSIIADSAYTYLMLGNFFDDLNTDTVMYSCGTCLNNFSYYLVDNICVSTDSAFCNGGIDVVSCAVSVQELSSNNEVSIYPNPTTELVTISLPDIQYNSILLTDIFGEILYKENIDGKISINLNLNSYPSGIYLLKLISKNEQKTFSKKIIKL